VLGVGCQWLLPIPLRIARNIAVAIQSVSGSGLLSLFHLVTHLRYSGIEFVFVLIVVQAIAL